MRVNDSRSVFDLLTRQMDDRTRLAAWQSKEAETVQLQRVEESLLQPLAPAAARLLDLQA